MTELAAAAASESGSAASFYRRMNTTVNSITSPCFNLPNVLHVSITFCLLAFCLVLQTLHALDMVLLQTTMCQSLQQVHPHAGHISQHSQVELGHLQMLSSQNVMLHCIATVP